MADLAQGIECPYCKTLTACSGRFSDRELVGQCACCGRSVTVGNGSFVQGGTAELEALRAENAALREQLAPASAPAVEPVGEPPTFVEEPAVEPVGEPPTFVEEPAVEPVGVADGEV